MSKKMIALVLSAALIVGGAVAGTLAWLTAQSQKIENTFTIGDINIDLTETFNTDKNEDGTPDAWTGKMVPGNELAKDPKVTVKSGSEASWLFVKVEKSSNLDTYIDYSIADGWTALDGKDGVYYREAAATDEDVTYEVLKDSKVTVKEEVTKAQMEALKATDAVQPTLSFTAYAVQKDNIADAAAAWTEVSKQDSSN